jgi:hypothetical protein
MAWFGWIEREEKIIRLAGQEVPYLLKRSARRRTIALRIDAKGLTVNAPARASQRRLEAVLLDKAGWVLDKLAEMQARRIPSIQWQDGEALPYLGGELNLILLPGTPRARPELEGTGLKVALPDPADTLSVQTKVVKWYRGQAQQHFADRVAVYAERLGVALPPLKLSAAATRWGSCNARGEIRLNWRLIKAQPHLIDYVVAHELAHLRHLNHSPAFWQTVARLYPEHRDARAELHALGHLLHTF